MSRRMPITPIARPSGSRRAEAFRLVGMTSPLALRGFRTTFRMTPRSTTSRSAAVNSRVSSGLMNRESDCSRTSSCRKPRSWETASLAWRILPSRSETKTGSGALAMMMSASSDPRHLAPLASPLTTSGCVTSSGRLAISDPPLGHAEGIVRTGWPDSQRPFWRYPLRRMPHQCLSVRRRRRLVHEIHVDLAPPGRRKPSCPLLEIGVRVGFEPEPDVAPRSCLHQGRRRVVFALREAQRRAGRLERVVYIVGEPALVAKLERGAMSLGQQVEKFAQPRQVFLHERRQLEKHRAALGAECHQVLVEKTDRIGCRFRLEPRHMGDAARSLDREAEALRRRRRPAFEHVHLGHSIEGVINLDARQAFSVPGQHGIRLDVRWIEISFPLLVGVAARASQQPHGISPRISPCSKTSSANTPPSANSKLHRSRGPCQSRGGAGRSCSSFSSILLPACTTTCAWSVTEY